MASDGVKMRQEMPPKGGYPMVEYQRNLPRRGVSGAAMIIGSAAIMSFGFYLVIKGNRHRRVLKQERLEARHFVRPLIQAEEDRRILRRLKCLEYEEAKIMQNVPGWVIGESVYHTDRWVQPPAEQLSRF
ncbi:NADH dehydrogenase [ubiquinone] 1 alpha subcomplex subunit 13 [Trichoplax sp. H2]|uniref:NADH dehydrogenase [ubiquinone] 1 alpha subcomplex subunit 13 n=1 Tax=Trichoplax adhaerens TaxID=10228 RepID=B3RSM4_TRIAD|nr:hypothetical protein TRIADDRAFT_54658 [Trichoplax adhaerens]EDV26540.1 hypothetical protein TRIADDRAFT_54658 [Trichoplax adhaerens]RDD40373.1 NADH dehydrogenase [ubiquinone] 1 alpha subcomplex subunit 13 [Trichoplax sp. H2]|eukprot:XP_002110536.1 hypothetical protein TRIADDRAFT_54658 [Trichoplax adhaerens]